MTQQILLTLLLATVVSISPISKCQPFGIRLFYGEVLKDPDSPELAVIFFNTHRPCSSSFVSLRTDGGEANLECKATAVVASQKMGYYTTYVHQCPLRDILFGEKFSYKVFGWAGKGYSRTPEALLDWVEASLKDPKDEESEFSFLTLGDWGPIKEKAGSVVPILPYMQKEIESKNIDAVIIVGDIAYDLDSQNGVQYQAFLRELENISQRTPILLVPGNHEHLSNDDETLMNESFMLYGLDRDKACGLFFGNSYLIVFDPYNAVYDYPDSSLTSLKAELKKSQKTRRFTWATSHYPLSCSTSQTCPQSYKRLVHHFNELLDYGVGFYLGAHAHAYERLYPYLRDGTFSKIDPPYQSGEGYIVSVVEGVGGNDHNLVQELTKKGEETAMYTVGQTGFAVLKSSKDMISYSHFSTGTEEYVDTMVLKKRQRPRRRKHLSSE